MADALLSQANALLAQGDPRAAWIAMGRSADEFDQLTSVYSGSDLTNAVSGFVNRVPNAQASVAALAQVDYAGLLKDVTGEDLPGVSDLIAGGESVLKGDLFAAMGPIIAGTLTGLGVVTGGIAPGVIAAIAGAVELGTQELQSLGVLGPDGPCRWQVGGLCFRGPVPYGPTDPTWEPLAVIAQDHANDSPWPQFSLDPFYATIVSEIQGLENPSKALARSSPVSKDPRLDGFRLAFNRTYLAQLERGVNGQPYKGPTETLLEVHARWNDNHSPTQSITVIGDSAPTGFLAPGGVYKETFLEAVLRGDADGTRGKPLTINVASNARITATVARARERAQAAATSAVNGIAGALALPPPFSPPKRRTVSLNLHGISKMQPLSKPMPKTISLNLTGISKMNFSGLTAAQSDAIDRATAAARPAPSAPPSDALFTVAGHTVTKKQAGIGAVVGAGLLALKFLR